MFRLRFSIEAICLFLILLSSSRSATGQEVQPDPRITEVYGAYTSQLSPEQLAWLDNQLSRCQLLQEPANPSEHYTLISEVPLVSKYAPQQANAAINLQTFNPLKYAIDFHKKTDVKYRIDGTDYVLLIHKKR